MIKRLEQAGLGYHVDADKTTDRLGIFFKHLYFCSLSFKFYFYAFRNFSEHNLKNSLTRTFRSKNFGIRFSYSYLKKKTPIRTLYSVCTVVLIGRFWSMIAKLFKQTGGTRIPRLGSGLWAYDTILNNIKWLTMFFKTRWRFSVISHRRVKPLRW